MQYAVSLNGKVFAHQGLRSARPPFPHRTRQVHKFPTAQSAPSSSQLNLSLRNPFQSNDNKKHASKKIAKTVITRTAIALCALTFFQSPALAKAAAAVAPVEHLHTGQKIANFFMQSGLPKWAVLATISAMPVVELRGAIPVGIWLGMPITQVLPICVMGNMIPIVPLLFLLRNEKLK